MPCLCAARFNPESRTLPTRLASTREENCRLETRSPRPRRRRRRPPARRRRNRWTRTSAGSASRTRRAAASSARSARRSATARDLAATCRNEAAAASEEPPPPSRRRAAATGAANAEAKRGRRLGGDRPAARRTPRRFCPLTRAGGPARTAVGPCALPGRACNRKMRRNFGDGGRRRRRGSRGRPPPPPPRQCGRRRLSVRGQCLFGCPAPAPAPRRPGPAQPAPAGPRIFGPGYYHARAKTPR